MTPAKVSFLSTPAKKHSERYGGGSSRSEAAGKLRNSLGVRTETSPPLRLSQVLGTGGRAGRLLRAGNSCQEQRAEYRHSAQPVVSSPSSPPSLPEGQGQRRPPPSSPPLWCLQPGGGSDPRQLTQHRHCLSHSPQNTRWAQRRVCSTAATTQAAAPATLNCLPDRRHHCRTPEKPSPPTAGDSTGPPKHLLDRLKLRQQLWQARGGGRSRRGKDGGCTSRPGLRYARRGPGSPLKMAAAVTRLRIDLLRRRATAGGK